MTKREKVKAVIEGKILDAPPYYIDLTVFGKQKMADYYGIKPEQVQEVTGNHLLYLNFTESDGFVPELIGENLYNDEFGVTWDNGKTREIGDWGLVENPVKNMEIGDYIFPTGKGSGRFVQAAKMAAENPDCFSLLQMTGVFDTAWHVTGIQDMLMAMSLDSGFADKMLDLSLEYNLNIIEQVPDNIEGIRFLEDWGDQRCLMMGMDYWRRYLKPRLKIMYEAARKKGKAVFIHSCGNVTDVFPDLIELGVDVADPIQPEVMDLEFIKREYGQDIVLFGGIGSQSTIPLGTTDMIINECYERLALLSKGGKYIMGPSGAIPNDTPVENIAALIEFCQKM